MTDKALPKKQVIDYFKDMLVLFERLEEQYNKLAQLEIENRMDSSEARETCEYIWLIKDVLDEKWEKHRPSFDDLFDFDDYLSALITEFIGDGKQVIDELLNYSKNNSIFRLSYFLYTYTVENKVYDLNISGLQALRENQEAIEEFNEMYGDDEEFDEDDLEAETIDMYKYATESLEKSLDIEYLRLMLYTYTIYDYLEEAIRNENNKKVREYLIKIKYSIIFTYPTLENRFLAIADKAYSRLLIERLIEKYYMSSDEEFDTAYTFGTYESIEDSIEELQNINSIKSPLAKAKAIAKVANTKALISITRDDYINHLIEEMQEAAISETKNNVAKKLVRDSFALNKELTIIKNVD